MRRAYASRSSLQHKSRRVSSTSFRPIVTTMVSPESRAESEQIIFNGQDGQVKISNPDPASTPLQTEPRHRPALSRSCLPQTAQHRARLFHHFLVGRIRTWKAKPIFTENPQRIHYGSGIAKSGPLYPFQKPAQDQDLSIEFYLKFLTLARSSVAIQYQQLGPNCLRIRVMQFLKPRRMTLKGS